MKNPIIAVGLCLVFCGLSCSKYSQISVSLNEASNQGKVKVATSIYDDYVFNNIEQSNGLFYGVKGDHRIELTEEDIHGVYLSTPKVYGVRVDMLNQNQKIKGYLYEVRDSMVLVSSKNHTIQEIKVSEIEALSLRARNKIGKGVGIGAGVGFAAGLIASAAVDGDGYEWIILPPLGFLAGSFVGLLAGTYRKNIEINGSYYLFNINKYDLQRMSTVVEE